MLGAYLAYSLSSWLGFWPALLLAPLGVGLPGAVFERFSLRRVRRFGHMSELLITFGLSYILVEGVQLIWGRSSVDYRVPAGLDGPLFTLFDTQFPLYRAFIMAVTLGVLGALALLVRTRVGLVVRAARCSCCAIRSISLPLSDSCLWPPAPPQQRRVTDGKARVDFGL